MIHVEVTKLSPDKTERLRSWLAEVQTRSEEARVTLASEGVRHERGLLVDTPAGPLLIRPSRPRTGSPDTSEADSQTATSGFRGQNWKA